MMISFIDVILINLKYKFYMYIYYELLEMV